MKKLQRSINTEFSDLTTSIGNDIGLLRSAVDESSASVKPYNETNIRLLKESAEKELNNLNEKNL